jgi:hypothetical protein
MGLTSAGSQLSILGDGNAMDRTDMSRQRSVQRILVELGRVFGGKEHGDGFDGGIELWLDSKLPTELVFDFSRQ